MNKDKEKLILELIEVIKDIENNWITASHYWGSDTEEKARKIIKEATHDNNQQTI